MKLLTLPWKNPMRGRDPHEHHRAATPLELFFDLTFVVAVAAAASGLHHGLAHGEMGILLGYVMVFFAIWWAWDNYTWFASAYDTGDVAFRLMTFVVMAGVLVLAAGVPGAMSAKQDFVLVVWGYLIMRVAMLPMWWRVMQQDPARKTLAQRYFWGTVVLQLLWILRAVVWRGGTVGIVSFFVLTALEMLVPLVAEGRRQQMPWHPHHIAERYELFTIIVLGEVILASTQGVTALVQNHGFSADLLYLMLGAFLIVLSVWWLYFKVSAASSLTRATRYIFNYMHYLIFASVAALGGCLDLMIDVVQHEAHLPVQTANLLLASALSVYIFGVTFVHGWFGMPNSTVLTGVGLIVVLLGVASLGLAPGLTTLIFGLLLAAALAHFLLRPPRLLE